VRARRVGPGGARPEGDDVLFVTADRAVAVRLRARHHVARVVVAADPLPFAQGVLDELVDEAAARPEVVAEDARVVREGGKVVLVADARGAGALAVVRLWKKGPPPLAATDASAWLLGAGCEELTQTAPREGLVVTEGRVRTRV
jgi:hypothetical protein